MSIIQEKSHTVMYRLKGGNSAMYIGTSGLKTIIGHVCTPKKCSGVNLSHTDVEGVKNIVARGSATVEAAIVMPLFIYAVAAVIYMMQIMMIKQDMNTAMYNTVRTMSKYSYVYNKLSDSDKEVSAITAYGTLLSYLGVDYAKNNHIVGGNAGIVMLGTKVLGKDADISVKVTYSVKNPLDVFGIGIVPITQTYSVQGWVGDEGVSSELKDSKEEKAVYITLYGEVYHTNEDCAYIELSVVSILASGLYEARNLGGGKFYACELCMDNVKLQAASEVYITEYGDRYHSSRECSGIKRTIIKVPLSKVEERQLCKKCRNHMGG